MLIEAIQIGVVVAPYVYHRLFDDITKSKPQRQLPYPRTEEGAPIPFIYGRCRIRTPILAWIRSPGTIRVRNDDGTGTGTGYDSLVPGVQFLYELNMFFVLGIPFPDGHTQLHRIWAGEAAMATQPDDGPDGSLADLTGDGGPEPAVYATTADVLGLGSGTGFVEFLNGNSSQQLEDVAYPHTATTYIGEKMQASETPGTLAGYRGYASVFLLGDAASNSVGGTVVPDRGWIVGPGAQPPTYSFEASSYPTDYLDREDVNLDANPIDVIRDVLIGKRGKLGLDVSLIDYASFFYAAVAVREEGNGYSRAIEQGQTADDIIQEILRQVDGTIYLDEVDGLFKIKLVRDDFEPADLYVINPSNCVRLENPAVGGATGLVNKVRVVFTDRDNDYQDGSAVAKNSANAVGQSGVVNEIVLQMPGVCNQASAEKIAKRELRARSRPMFKCTAIVDRQFLRHNPGDVVGLRWPLWNITGLIMRVAGVTRGAPGSNEIKLDLIQDFFGHSLDEV